MQRYEAIQRAGLRISTDSVTTGWRGAGALPKAVRHQLARPGQRFDWARRHSPPVLLHAARQRDLLVGRRAHGLREGDASSVALDRRNLHTRDGEKTGGGSGVTGGGERLPMVARADPSPRRRLRTARPRYPRSRVAPLSARMKQSRPRRAVASGAPWARRRRLLPRGAQSTGHARRRGAAQAAARAARARDEPRNP